MVKKLLLLAVCVVIIYQFEYLGLLIVIGIILRVVLPSPIKVVSHTDKESKVLAND